MADDHKDAIEAHKVCSEAAQDNNDSYLEDYRFSLLDDQWEAAIKADRSTPGQERPMYTFNQLPAFGRQVVNDIRQNKPSIKFRPADSGADIETALVYTGLVRNIENVSRADIARDTAAHCAVHGGFGFYRIDIDYACDDTFDLDIRIVPIPNPLSVLPDPYTVAGDSLDWNMAFVGELMTPDAFKEAYPKADPVSFSGMDKHIKRDWTNGEDILVAEYWKRSKVRKTILLLSDRTVVYEEEYMKPGTDGPTQRDINEAQGITVLKSREIESYVVDQCILNGQEILAEKTRWVGRYIPIIPVYGEELNVEGKRILRSMIHRAKDAQRQVNYWETTATEMVALAPRVPFIGEEGAFSIDANWSTANSQNHPYLEYKKGLQMPQRQPVDSGPAVGAMQEAMRANDKMKAVLGMYDASLGARSNETSGKAINARKVEGDVGQFHFTDNVNRAIHCEGIQLADLIPKVYTKDRIVRVLGDDGAEQEIKLGQRQRPEPPVGQDGQPVQDPTPPKIGTLDGVYDLAVGKYDVTVEAGPSYTTQRQETAAVIGEMGRANPAIWQIGGDIMVRNLDLKDGDELARRMKKMLPPQLQDNAEQQIPPQVQQALEQGKQIIAEQQAKIQELEQDQVGKIATAEKAKADHEKNQVEMAKTDLERQRLPIEADQAQASLILAQATLEEKRAQLGATQAATDTTKATGDAMGAINAAATMMAAAAQRIAQTSVIHAAPKRKHMTVQKVNGAWVGESVETPDVGVQ